MVTTDWRTQQHNRPDGSECDYVAAFVCNKCGTTVERRSGTERRKWVRRLKSHTLRDTPGNIAGGVRFGEPERRSGADRRGGEDRE